MMIAMFTGNNGYGVLEPLWLNTNDPEEAKKQLINYGEKHLSLIIQVGWQKLWKKNVYVCSMYHKINGTVCGVSLTYLKGDKNA